MDNGSCPRHRADAVGRALNGPARFVALDAATNQRSHRDRTAGPPSDPVGACVTWGRRRGSAVVRVTQEQFGPAWPAWPAWACMGLLAAVADHRARRGFWRRGGGAPSLVGTSCGLGEHQDPRPGAASHPDQHADGLGRRKGAPRPYGSGLRPPLPPTGGSRTEAGCEKRPGVWRRTSTSVTASSSSRPEGGFRDRDRDRDGAGARYRAPHHRRAACPPRGAPDGAR